MVGGVAGEASEGDRVEVTSGTHQGQHGVVVKVTGTGSETRFRVTLDGGGRTTWVDGILREGAGTATGSDRSALTGPAEQFQKQGKAGGKGRRKSGQGKGTASPAESASPSGAAEGLSKGKGKKGPALGKGAAGGKSAPNAWSPPKDLDVGAFVEITSGDYAGCRGHVIKVMRERNKDPWKGITWSVRWRVQLVEGDSLATWVQSVTTVPQEQFGLDRAASGPARRYSQRKAEQVQLQAEQAQRHAEHKAQRKTHFAALRPADINNVQWANKRDSEHLYGGRGGVELVDLMGECVALKQLGETAISEVLSEHVATASGIRVARCRILNYTHAEFEELKRAGVGYGMGTAVLEYVPGHVLMGVEAQQVLVSPKDTLLLDLGRLCALDVALNNFDRVPLPIWQNNGNFGNVMVVGGGAGIVGIDQQLNLIKEGPFREAYLAKVHSLVLQVLPGGDASTIIAKLREALAVNCGAELSDAHVGIFLQGLQEGLREVAEAWETQKLQEGLAIAKQFCWDHINVDSLSFDMNLRNGEMLEMVAFVETVAETISKSLHRTTA